MSVYLQVCVEVYWAKGLALIINSVRLCFCSIQYTHGSVTLGRKGQGGSIIYPEHWLIGSGLEGQSLGGRCGTEGRWKSFYIANTFSTPCVGEWGKAIWGYIISSSFIFRMAVWWHGQCADFTWWPYWVQLSKFTRELITRTLATGMDWDIGLSSVILIYSVYRNCSVFQFGSV